MNLTQNFIVLVSLLLSLSAAAKQTTVLEVSKTINSKNVLHYKVNYDEATCELKSNVFADWKMDEEDGRWKSLDESPGMIRRPLEPTTSKLSAHELVFVTSSMDDFAQKGYLDQKQVVVRIEEDSKGDCVVKNEISIGGKDYDVHRIHSKVTLFGNVKWVEVTAQNDQNKSVTFKLKN